MSADFHLNTNSMLYQNFNDLLGYFSLLRSVIRSKYLSSVKTHKKIKLIKIDEDKYSLLLSVIISELVRSASYDHLKSQL